MDMNNTELYSTGKKRTQGFTLVELLIVIIVITIIAAITFVAFSGIQSRAAASSLQADLKNASIELALNNTNNGIYPASLTTVNNNKGLSKSPDTSYQYEQLNDGAGYCLTATSARGGVSAYSVSDSSGVEEGACNGHDETSNENGGTTATAPDAAAGEFVLVPGNSYYGTSDFYVAKYEAKNVDGKAVSQAAGRPWIAISQASSIATAAAACDGCQLITDAQWMTLAENIMSVGSNWSGGSVGSGVLYRGHTDNNPSSSLAADVDSNPYSGTGQTTGDQRRTLTLTNGEVIWDLSSNVYEWTQSTITGSQPTVTGQTGYAWREYNNPNLVWNNLPTTSRPSGTLYPSSAGVGSLYSNVSETGTKVSMRGGYWARGTNAGLLALALSNNSTGIYSNVSFRVTH